MPRHGLRHPSRSVVLAAVLLPYALAGCGGSSHSASTRATTTTPAAPTGGVSATSGSIHATLVAATHHPVAGKNWIYTVTATDTQGHPLSGTVETEFAFGGAVVGKETPAVHPLTHGRLKDMFKFPARSVGYPLEVRLIVHTPKGSVTLNWPVTIRR